MKKLMIIAAVAMAVFASNAATMKWGTSAMKTAAGTTSTTANTTAMMYVLSDTEYSAFTAAVSGMDATALSKYVYENFNDKTGGVKSGAFSKGAATFTDPTDYAAGDSAYAVFLFTSVKDDAVYAMGNYGSWDFDSAVDKTLNLMGQKIGGSGAATAWAETVPEPTSGLLLLLGMAGLALKRKQA